MSTAFVYVEIDNSVKSSSRGKPIYTIHYNGKPAHGCSQIQSPDEDFFREKLNDLRGKEGITLLSRLPPSVESFEGTIERTPYNLSSLFQTSARDNGNKKKAKK